ncbi:MAG: hypothetical protein IIW97_02105 [Alistipes sp.]|nr:hypothetical protein [Alistipes sp.]
MKRFLLSFVAVIAAMSSAVAQKDAEFSLDNYLSGVESFDYAVYKDAEGKDRGAERDNVYEYPTNNGIYAGYLYTNDLLKDEPYKIEYGTNFLYSMSTKDYNRFYVGYSVPNIIWKAPVESNKEDYPFTQGFHVGYLHASHLSKKIPLYLEYGVNFQYLFGRASQQYNSGGGNSHFWITNWGSMYSLNVPLNLAMRLGFHGGEKAITPYLGVNLRYNVGGTIKQRERGLLIHHMDMRRLIRLPCLISLMIGMQWATRLLSAFR